MVLRSKTSLNWTIQLRGPLFGQNAGRRNSFSEKDPSIRRGGSATNRSSSESLWRCSGSCRVWMLWSERHDSSPPLWRWRGLQKNELSQTRSFHSIHFWSLFDIQASQRWMGILTSIHKVSFYLFFLNPQHLLPQLKNQKI